MSREHNTSTLRPDDPPDRWPKGIGLETARLARSEGANIIITARNPKRLHRVGVEASIAALDVTDLDRLGQFLGEGQAYCPTPLRRPPAAPARAPAAVVHAGLGCASRTLVSSPARQAALPAGRRAR